MNATGSTISTLDWWTSKWLTHQRALGRGCREAEWVMRKLNRFIETASSSDLNEQIFDRWCATFQHLAGNTRRGRQMIVRRFCLYRQRTEPACFVPSALYFARSSQYRRPVIITPEQIGQMMVKTNGIKPSNNSPLLPHAMRLAIVILYTAGLRRGELSRLTLGDVEPETGLLRIRESKFHKSRLIPLSADAAQELRNFLLVRCSPKFDTQPEAPLLFSDTRGHRPYTGEGLREALVRLFRIANVRDDEGRFPRVHDVRHSFAVEALLRWYREEADVQTLLPRLAMYMGHVSIVSTAHYLHFVPTLRTLASQRFESAFGHLVKEIPT